MKYLLPLILLLCSCKTVTVRDHKPQQQEIDAFEEAKTAAIEVNVTNLLLFAAVFAFIVLWVVLLNWQNNKKIKCQEEKQSQD
jgi:hypothetical protein